MSPPPMTGRSEVLGDPGHGVGVVLHVDDRLDRVVIR
jgi:hypothetical protein